MDLKEELLLGDSAPRHWYYRAKLSALRRLIAGGNHASLLDVGAGTGFFARSLLECGDVGQATCVDPGYPEDRDETVQGRKLSFRRRADQEQADLVLMMDVIEHVADDVGLVREYVAAARPGARFVVSVPAFMWLWSGHDVFLEHHRRYTLPQVEQVLRNADLTVERGCYFYGALLPLAAATRLAKRLAGRDRPESQMSSVPAPANALLGMVCSAELPLMKANRIAGLTAFVTAVRT